MTTSGPIWQRNCEKLKITADFIFLDSKITVDGKCSFLGRKAMPNIDSIKKKKSKASLC